MARLTGRSVFDLLEDYRQLIEAAENVPIDHKRLRAYQRFLQREAHRLERDPDALLPLAWNAPLDHPVHQDAENSSLRPAGPWLRRLNPPQQDLIRAIHNEHEGRVTALALSAKSHRAVSADSAKLIWWDIETGRTKILTEFSGSVFTKVSISSDGRRVVVLVDDGSAPHGASYGAVICCDSERGVIRHVSASSDSHSSVGCSCSGRFAVLGYPDGTLVYWDCWIDDQQPKKLVLKAHMAEVRDVSLSADGQRLVSMDQSGKVFLWDLEEHDEPRELSGFGSLKSVAISSDGSSVVLLDCDGYLTQADTATTSEICRTRLFDKPDFAGL